MGKDYYAILDIYRNAEEHQISKSFRYLALKNHPDIAQSLESERIFNDICEAYEVLRDAKRRAVYDACGEDGLKNGIPSLADFQNGWVYHEDSREVFRNFFGGTNPFQDFQSCARNFSNAPMGMGAKGFEQQDEEVLKELWLDLEEIFHGCVKKMRIQRQELEDGDRPVQREKVLTIKVTPGWRENTRVTFRNEGDQGPNNNPADIVFIVKERRHDRFLRAGNDLIYPVELPLTKALTGCTISVPTLDNRKLSIPISEVIKPNYEKRISGEGMPWSKDCSQRGDLVIRCAISFPDTLSPAQKEAVRKALLA